MRTHRNTAARAARRAALALAGAAFLGLAGARAQDGASPPVAAAPALERLDALLEPLRAAHELPALAAAVTDGQRLLALGAVGRRRADQETPIADDDRWHIGSCTKSITATWIALLVERGELSWETTVGEVYADLLADGRMDPAWSDVPLEWLLQNRAGAPHELREDGLWARLWTLEGPPPEQRRALVEGVLARPPVAPPGTKYVYSNAGFSIAAAMAETVLGAPYEERLRADLLDPLGMASFGFGAPGADGSGAPCGHRLRSRQLAPVEPGPRADNPDAIAPAGKLHGALADWARYARLHLGAARGGEDALLSADGLARLHAPGLDGYAMGWLTSTPEWAGGPILWHNGSNTMWYCELVLLPEEDLALLVVTNRGDAAARRGVAAAVRALLEPARALRAR